MKANCSRYSAVHSAVGAAVDEQGLAPLGGQHGAQRRPADAADALVEQRRPGQQRAGGAGADQAIALALIEQAHAHRHGGVGLFPHGGGRMILHGDHLGRVHQGDARPAAGVYPLHLRLAQALLHLRLPAHQRDGQAKFLRGLHRALDNFARGVVAAHGVDNHVHASASFTARCRRGFAPPTPAPGPTAGGSSPACRAPAYPAAPECQS